MWNIVFLAIAFAFVVPLVSFDLEEATATSEVGARGGRGLFLTTPYYANFETYPTGGYVSCDFPERGELLYTKDKFCDVVQYGLPITTLVLAFALIASKKWDHIAIAAIKWLLAASVLALLITTLVITTDKGTYLNVGGAKPDVSIGAILLIIATILLAAIMVKSMFFSKTETDFSPDFLLG